MCLHNQTSKYAIMGSARNYMCDPLQIFCLVECSNGRFLDSWPSCHKRIIRGLCLCAGSGD